MFHGKKFTVFFSETKIVSVIQGNVSVIFFMKVICLIQIFKTMNLFSFLVFLLTPTIILSTRWSICNIHITECTLRNLHLTKSDYTFHPLANNIHAESVHKIIFQSSSVPVVYDNVCQMFSNITKYFAHSIGIEIIDPETFKNCKTIQEIRLHDNQIKYLDENTFSNNRDLLTLDLSKNQLRSISGKLLKTTWELEFFSVSNNHLVEFPTNIICHLRKLSELHLHRNELIEVDAGGLVKCLSVLKRLSIDRNFLRCHGLDKILDIFKQHQVDLINVIRYRNMNDIDYSKTMGCLNEQDWTVKNILREYPRMKNELTNSNIIIQDLEKDIRKLKKDIQYLKYVVTSIVYKIEDDENVFTSPRLLEWIPGIEEKFQNMKCKKVCYSL